MDNNDYMSYYNDDYNYDDNEYHYESNKKKKRKKQESNNNRMLYLVLGIIAIILIFMLFTNSCSQQGTVNNTNPLVIDVNSFNLEIGESATINASVNNQDENPEIIWESSDSTIVSVENGVIKAKKEGLAIITVSYKDSDNQVYKQECSVTVNAKPSTPPTTPPSPPPSSSDTIKPTLDVTITNGTNEWYTSDVSIKVSASDASGISNVKYTINCNNSCTYTNVSNNGTFKVSNNGTNTITVIATDKKGNQTTKSVTVKIDKTAPVVKLNITGTKVYNNTGSVQVCASCTDTGSGCTQNQVCKTYTSNQTNVTIEVSDKANNKTKTTPFSVIIDKTAPTCVLRINEDTSILTGTASDTGGSGIAYYGYNASYTGSNTATKKGVQGFNYFYVKDNAGNVGRCSINLAMGYRSRTCAEKDYTWTLTSRRTCGDGFKNRSKEDAIANNRLWYRTNCEKSSSLDQNASYSKCTNYSNCYCCKEYTGTINGCKSFEGSPWSDWSFTPIQSDEFTQVESKLTSAD